MKLSIPSGTTSKRIGIFIQDSSSTVGAGLSGLAFNTSGLKCYSWIDTDGNAAGTAQTLATATLGTWTTIGFVEKDSTNMKGMYEFGIPNALIAAGVKWAIVYFYGATNMAPLVLEIEVTAVSNQDSVRGGMTALPNAAAEASGGLYTRGTGAGQIKQTNNGEIDSNVTHINNVATTSVTTINANQGTTGVVTFTVAAQVDCNVKDWAGTAVSAPATAGIPEVNIKNVNNVSAASVTTVNANQGTTQPVNFTGTAGSALVKSDSVDIGSVAQTGLDIAANYTAARATKLDNLDAAVSSRSTLTQAQIISDATPFPGADIDAAVSSRAPSATALSTANWTNARAAFLDNLNVLKIKKNTALANFGFLMVLSADHITPATGLTVVVQRSIDGGAFGNATNSPATEIASGCYKISLSAADLNGDIIILKMTSATADQRTIIIATEP